METHGFCGGSASIPLGDPTQLHDLCQDTVACMSRLHRVYGSIVGYPKGSELTVFAFGPQANHDIYSDPGTFHVYGPPGPRNSAQRRFGLGLFGLNGLKQQQHRRLLMPAVSKHVVEASAPSMLHEIRSFLAGWRLGQTIDLYAAMKELSLRIAGKLLFGLEDFTIAHTVAAAFQDWLDDYVRVLFALTLPVDLPARQYQQWLAAGERFEVHLRHMLQQRQQTLTDRQYDLMALLLRARANNQITEAEVIGEMQTLFNAAYQTTAAGLTWTMLLLTQHPDILTAVLEESPQTALLDRVIRESLRILPPVVFVIRRAVRPACIAGHLIPEGTVVILSLYVTHHQAEIYPEPERFWPDRWLRQKVSPYAYVPFGAGPRMCMGTAFSMQLFHLTVPAVIHAFRLGIVPGSRVDRHASLTMGVDGPLPATLYPRDSWLGTAVPLQGNIHEMVHLPTPAVPGKVA